mmetsp:Transcript_42035/g.104608  ORF Transcript_42035/g.104608 Transcript_42035/m.104608 type:complete len:107 (-) Transcript_42035:243-563(-)
MPAPRPCSSHPRLRRAPAIREGSTLCASCKYGIRSRAATSYAARFPARTYGAAVLPSSALVRRGSLAIVLLAGLPRRPSAAHAARSFDIRDDARSNAAAPAEVGTI